jgi:hypothetical protein
VKKISSFSYNRRKVWLEAKLLTVEALISWKSKTKSSMAHAPDVLDRMRANQALERRIDTLATVRIDLLEALALLDYTRSPFFGL